jgi:WXG100 family type VII secretion target
MTDPLHVDPAVLAKEAANFERIAEELKAQIVRVETTAAELFDSKWKGPAADAAKRAVNRYLDAARQLVAQLNEISISLYEAGIRYTAADVEEARQFAAQTPANGEDDDKEHKGHVKLVDNIKRRWTDKDLYPDDPTAADIRQDRIGDCYLDSTMGAIANANPQWIKDRIHYDDKTGNFDVTLWDGHQWKHIAVTQDDIKVDVAKRGASWLDNGQPNAALWPSVLESAYAKQRVPGPESRRRAEQRDWYRTRRSDE